MMYRIYFSLTFLSFFVKAELPFKFDIELQTYPIYVSNNDSFYKSYNNRPELLKELNLGAATVWNYTVDINEKTCEIREFKAKIDYVIPVFLENDDSLSKDYSERARQIYDHEERHCSIVVKNLDTIYELFNKSSVKTCKENLVYSEVLKDKTDEDNYLFDVYTSNGEIELAESPFEDDNYVVYCKIEAPVHELND